MLSNKPLPVTAAVGGPQADRDRVVIGRHAELAREREDIAGSDLGSERRMYEGEVDRLRRENISLRDQLQRAFKELKFYQYKYPSAYANAPRDDNDDLPPWKTSHEVMTPLLHAYDTHIAELEANLERQREELHHSKEKLEICLAENEQLRAAQLENLSRNAGRPSLASPLNDEFIAEMEKRVEILMAENAVMMEQKVVLTEEFDKCRADIATYQEELTILSQQYNVIKQENADNKTMLAQAERDRAKATEEVAKASEALAKAEVEVDELKQQLFVLTEKNHRTDDELGETRRALKDLSDRAESEGFACVRRTKAAEDRVRELQGVLLIKTQELDVAQDTLSKLRREYQSTRQDAEGMLQVMAGLERQLTEYAAREAEVERVEKECKDRIEEATIARDQALAREHQFQRSYEKILEDRRLEAQEKQNEIDEAVAQTRSRAEQKIRQLDEQIHAANARNAELKANEERIQREYLSTREALDRARTQHEEERKSMEATMRAMEDRMKQVESERIDDSAKRREIQEQNKSLRITVDNLRAQVETNRVQLTDRDLGRDREMVQVKTTLKDAQAQLSDVNKALQRKSKELEDLRIEMSEQIVAIEKRRDEDVGMYRRRAEEADLKMHELETSCLSEARRSKYIIDQTKEKYSNAVQQFELKLEEEKTNNRRWTNQNRELLESLRLMTEEKISIEKVSAALKSKCSSMREELAEAQRTISDLTVQLTQSFEAREEAVKASVRELAAINSTNKLKTKVVSFLPSNDDERMSFAAADAVSALSFGNLGVETDENDVDVFQAEIEKRNFEDMLQEAHRTFVGEELRSS